MAAIWVSNSGRGTSPKRSTKISMSCRAAWNTFITAWSASSRAERGEIDVRRLRIDHRDLVLAGKLHDAEFRPVGAFAHEFGIDGDEFLRRETVAEGLQRLGGGDQGRRREPGARLARHRTLLHGGCRLCQTPTDCVMICTALPYQFGVHTNRHDRAWPGLAIHGSAADSKQRRGWPAQAQGRSLVEARGHGPAMTMRRRGPDPHGAKIMKM